MINRLDENEYYRVVLYSSGAPEVMLENRYKSVVDAANEGHRCLKRDSRLSSFSILLLDDAAASSSSYFAEQDERLMRILG